MVVGALVGTAADELTDSLLLNTLLCWLSIISSKATEQWLSTFHRVADLYVLLLHIY
jgi:hypothetical protein